MGESVSITSLALETVQCVTEAENAFAELANRHKLTKPVDADCRELELKLKVGLATILQWREIWFVQADKSDDFFSTLWGQGGRNRIFELLESISRECGVIRKFAEESTERTENLFKKHNMKRANRPRNWPKWLRFNTKAQMDKAMNKSVRDNVYALSSCIDELWASSELYFRSLHGVLHSSNLPNSPPSPQHLLGNVLKSRHASISLYWHFYNWNMEVDLDLDLLNNDGEIDKIPDLFDWSDLKISYHFIGDSLFPGQPRDVIIEADARNLISAADDSNQEDVLEAKLEVALCQICTERTIRLPRLGNASELYVNLTCRVDRLRSRIEPQALPVFATESNNAQVTVVGWQITMAEKLSLAYRIAECTLFLLGTPWLSHLSSRSLRRSKASKVDYRYSMHVQWPATTDSTQPTQETIERFQIFQVGILLIEIALETTISTVDSRGIPSNMIPRIEDSMGPQYAQVCEFCLGHEDARKSGGSETAFDSGSLLQAYYSEVFIP